jgi:hypothetical protein
MYPLAPEQHDDPIFLDNIGMIYEVIPASEANEIRRKQQINQQVGPTAFDFLVNERGEKITSARVTQPFEQQSFTVANIQQAQDTRHTQNNEQLERPMGPQQVAVPGSPGTVPQVPSDIPAEQVADWIARNSPKGEDSNLGDVLRSQFNVRMEPPQRYGE